MSTTCANQKCKRRVRFAPVPTTVEWSPRSRTPLAIRCAFCLRVYCLRCALKHFGSERDRSLAGVVAQHLVALFTQKIRAITRTIQTGANGRKRPSARPARPTRSKRTG